MIANVAAMQIKTNFIILAIEVISFIEIVWIKNSYQKQRFHTKLFCLNR